MAYGRSVAADDDLVPDGDETPIIFRPLHSLGAHESVARACRKSTTQWNLILGLFAVVEQTMPPKSKRCQSSSYEGPSAKAARSVFPCT